MPRKLQRGQRVHSPRFGAGVILDLDGYGEKERATIQFDTAGRRQVLTGQFVLEPYDNELHAVPAPRPAAPEQEPAPARPAGEAPAAAGEAARRPPPREARGGREESMEEREAGPSGAMVEALRRVVREEMGTVEIRLMQRWKGGSMVLKPGDSTQQAREIPLDAFFHKIVMVRDRLRVLEQKLNAHEGLSDADKVELHQYITRIYGSLTTFNILFADRDDWFRGQKS